MRRVAAAFLVLCCIAPVFAQWGYIGVQLSDGSAAYLLFLLLPVAFGVAFLGTIPGVMTSLFAGAVLYLHARLMPLDYYELVYVTPVTSFVAIVVCGLVLGVFLSYATKARPNDERESSVHGDWRRVMRVSLSCLVASCAFSVVWALGSSRIAWTTGGDVPF